VDGLAFLQPAGQEAADQAASPEEEEIYCAACRTLVTRGRWRIAVNGAHEHTVFNPAGIVFTVLCFREAIGAASVGRASDVFTWFKGYAWRIAVCAACGQHLGWRYEGEALPPVFFGLIRDRLSFGRQGGKA
jgi:hypothetical protein